MLKCLGVIEIHSFAVWILWQKLTCCSSEQTSSFNGEHQSKIHSCYWCTVFFPLLRIFIFPALVDGCVTSSCEVSWSRMRYTGIIISLVPGHSRTGNFDEFPACFVNQRMNDLCLGQETKSNSDSTSSQLLITRALVFMTDAACFHIP